MSLESVGMPERNEASAEKLAEAKLEALTGKLEAIDKEVRENGGSFKPGGISSFEANILKTELEDHIRMHPHLAERLLNNADVANASPGTFKYELRRLAEEARSIGPMKMAA